MHSVSVTLSHNKNFRLRGLNNTTVFWRLEALHQNLEELVLQQAVSAAC